MASRSNSTRVADKDRSRFSLTKAFNRNSAPPPSPVDPTIADLPNPRGALAAAAAADFAMSNSTTLYVTYTAELRSDQDIYMFSIDKCYTTPEQANSRVRLLGESNFSLKQYRREKMSTMAADRGEGDIHVEMDDLKMITWKRAGPGNLPRFMATTKKIVMTGRIPATGEEESPVEDGGPNDISSLFVAFSYLEMPGHVWVVAMYQPKWLREEIAMVLNAPESGISRPLEQAELPIQDIMNDLNANDDEVRPRITWQILSVHRSSFIATTRAKQLWNQLFKPIIGRCTKDHEHYGFARFALKPTHGPSGNKIEYTGCDLGPQIRIERVKVNAITDKPEYYVPPPLKVQVRATVATNETVKKNNADLRKGIKPPEQTKEDKILVAPPLKCVDDKVISTAQGKRTSYIEDLQDTMTEALMPSFSYQDIPLFFKLKQRNLERWGELEDQRSGGCANLQEQGEVYADAEVYHGFMHNSKGDNNSPPSQKGKKSPKLRSAAYKKAQLRMHDAVEEQGFQPDVGRSAVADIVTTIEGGDGRKSISRASDRYSLTGEVSVTGKGEQKDGSTRGGSAREKRDALKKPGALRREGWGSEPPETRKKKRVSFAGL